MLYLLYPLSVGRPELVQKPADSTGQDKSIQTIKRKHGVSFQYSLSCLV